MNVKRKSIKFISFFIAAFMLIMTFSASLTGVSAAIQLGKKVNWSLDDSGTLLIYGNGDMDSYSSGNTPWYSKKDEIITIVVADGVTSIGSNSFSDCSNVVNVKIRDTVTTIDSYAFYKCGSLSKIDIPSSVEIIGFRAFAECASLEEIAFSEGLTKIDNRAFENCTSLKEIVLPESLNTIEAGAFLGCAGLRNVNFPDSVSKMGMNAFLGCSFIKLICNEGSYAESYAKQSILPYILNDVDPVSIAGGECGTDAVWELFSDGTFVVSGTGAMDAFSSAPWNNYNDYIREIVIEDGITSVSEKAFLNCPGIWSVTVSDSVTEIGDMAFGYYDRGQKTISDMVIYCYEGTAGEVYATDNGFVCEYIYRDDPILKPDSIYEIRDGYIFGVKLNTSVEEFTEQFNVKTEVFDLTGNEAVSGYVGTGFTVKAIDITLTVVVLGDITGDGEADSSDAVQVLKHDSAIIDLEGAFLFAADFNKDSEVNSLDAKNIFEYDAGIIEL
ncbi:MAG: leucine-rich repeat protein [Clostridia bacterium]|nr:leucine-rich repeat protein [Clostridia bacterium]